jgi:HAD superfamily hydrolase (TIGR01549 family)
LIRGVIFDLDGTLVSSQLDFDAMRSEMGLSLGVPILEAMKALPAEEAERCRLILHRHEGEGADRATLLPGVAEFLHELRRREKRLAVVTRNSREITLRTLARVQLEFELVVTRCDGPVKPDPWPIANICRQWNLPAREVVMIGDYRFDIECGQAAGCRTVLFTEGVLADTHPNDERADYLLMSFEQADGLLRWLDS